MVYYRMDSDKTTAVTTIKSTRNWASGFYVSKFVYVWGLLYMDTEILVPI